MGPTDRLRVEICRRRQAPPHVLRLAGDFLGAVETPAWIRLGHVSLFSMLIGFVFWYRGLAQGGIVSVGQLQLLQPFFGLALAATLLREHVTSMMLLVTIAVIGCVVGARRFRKEEKIDVHAPGVP